MHLGVQLFQKDKKAYFYLLVLYMLSSVPAHSVIFNRALFSCLFIYLFIYCHAGKWQRNVLSVQRSSVLSIKRHELRLGTTSLLPSFLPLISLLHGSEIIHPPTNRYCAGGRCQSARSMWCKGYACLCSACKCLYKPMNARVYIYERVCVGVVHFKLHLFVLMWP